MAGFVESSDPTGFDVSFMQVGPNSPQFSAVLAELQSEETFGKNVYHSKPLTRSTPTIQITGPLENHIDIQKEDANCESIAKSVKAVPEVFFEPRCCESSLSSSPEHNKTNEAEKSIGSEQMHSKNKTKERISVGKRSASRERRVSSPAALERFRRDAFCKDTQVIFPKENSPRLIKAKSSQLEKELIDLSIDINNNASPEILTANQAPGPRKEVLLSPALRRRSKTSNSVSFPSLESKSHGIRQAKSTESLLALTKQNRTSQPIAPPSPHNHRRHLTSDGSPLSVLKTLPLSNSSLASNGSLENARRHSPTVSVLPSAPKPLGSPRAMRREFSLSPIKDGQISTNQFHGDAAIAISPKEKNYNELTTNEIHRFRKRSKSNPCVSPILPGRTSSSANASPDMSPEFERKFQAFARSVAQSPRRTSHRFEDLTPLANSILKQASLEGETEMDLPIVSMTEVLKAWHVNDDKDSVRLLSHIGLRDRGYSVPAVKIDKSLTDCRYLRRRSDED